MALQIDAFNPNLLYFPRLEGNEFRELPLLVAEAADKYGLGDDQKALLKEYAAYNVLVYRSTFNINNDSNINSDTLKAIVYSSANDFKQHLMQKSGPSIWWFIAGGVLLVVAAIAIWQYGRRRRMW